MLRKSIFSYYEVVNGCMYLYNSLIGRDSLTKIYNSDRICSLEKLIKADDYKNGAVEDINILRDSGFLTNKTVVEEKMARTTKRKEVQNNKNLSLTIMPTTECNFNCVYCYEEYSPQYMSEETQKNLLSFVEEKMKECDNLYVNWFGGEPLLALDIIKSLSKGFINIAYKYKKNYFATMTTNGMKLTADVVKDLIKYRVISYQITIDGYEKTHDLMRKSKDGIGTYHTIVKNLLEIKQKVKSSIVKITIRTNYTKEIFNNIEKLYELMKMLDNKKFDFSIKLAANWGGNKVTKIKKELLDLSYYPKIIDYFLSCPDKPNFYTHVDFFDSISSICAASKKNGYVVNATGLLYKCTVDFNESIGTVNKKINENTFQVENIDVNCDSCFFSGCCLGITCPRAKKERQIQCPPEKIYISHFLQVLPEKCFKIIK